MLRLGEYYIVYFRLIYIIIPEVSKMKIIAKQINEDLKQGPVRTKRKILFLPHKVY
jgi:hypothetical protein